MHGLVPLAERGSPVDHHVRRAARAVGRDRDFDRPPGYVPDLPQRSRTRVTQHRRRPAAQDGSAPTPQLRDLRATDRVDAAPDMMQATTGEAMIDRLVTQPGLEQLAPGDQTVLPADELPQGGVP